MDTVAFREKVHIILHYVIRCGVVTSLSVCACWRTTVNQLICRLGCGLVDFGGPMELNVCRSFRWGPGPYPHGKGQFWGCPPLKCIKLYNQQMP